MVFPLVRPEILRLWNLCVELWDASSFKRRLDHIQHLLQVSLLKTYPSCIAAAAGTG